MYQLHVGAEVYTHLDNSRNRYRGGLHVGTGSPVTLALIRWVSGSSPLFKKQMNVLPPIVMNPPYRRCVLVFTCVGQVRAGEDEEDGVLPPRTLAEGQAELWDSSLCCCSGDRLSLLLSSSNPYESSCLGN